VSNRWTLAIYENQQRIRSIDLEGTAELGRQRGQDEEVFSCQRSGDVTRVVVVGKEVQSVGRHYFRVEPREGGVFRLSNIHDRLPVGLNDGRQLPPSGAVEVGPDVLITAGNLKLRLEPAPAEVPVQGLETVAVPPGQGTLSPPPFAGATTAKATVAVEDLLPWLQSVVDVLQSAAGSEDFYDRAARALVEMVQLDTGGILLRQGEGWHLHARFPHPPTPEAADQVGSQSILARVYRDKRTFWEVPEVSAAQAASLLGVKAVVAAPILDRAGAVVGAVYGERRDAGLDPSRGPLTHVEALLVELLARGVAAGRARQEQERKALAAQVQFEQFFTPELARQLAHNPDWLAGRTADVSVLFCDIRGFSRISEQLGAARTVEWCKAVLEHLSRCVLRHAGVLVDYTGDGLMALWGAPDEQPDHATRACRAAVDMLAGLAGLNREWQGELKRTMNLGVGIHSGKAVVGNVGSEVKFKYGARGPTVNLASRVEGATKHLKCQMLITAGTKERVGEEFATRRLCRVKVVNIEESVELYELALPDRPGWGEARREYEQALVDFEEKRFREAARCLAGLGAQQGEDGPALVLLSRVVNCMVEEPAAFDPVWVLPSK
jgi:adenylate cyclase